MINNIDDWESVSGLAAALSLEGRGFARNENFKDAEKQLRRAIAIDTYCINAYQWLEYVLDAQGRFDESCWVRELQRRAMLEMMME